MSNEQFKYGEWDSKHFGIKVVKVYPDVNSLIPWDKDLTIAITSNAEIIPELERIGFRYITSKIYMQYTKKYEVEEDINPNIRIITDDVVDKCAKIVSDSLVDQSPYTLSARIFGKEHILTKDKIKGMYAGWFKRIYNKPNSISLCILHNNEVAGTIISEFYGNRAENELFAVDNNIRGAGLGTQLGKAIFKMLPIGSTFEGVINLHNIVPIRLWESLGARIYKVEYVLHRWRD